MSVPPAHVLIVEDEPMIGRILEHKLAREGHRVSWVRTAEDAERALRGEHIDVALVDVTLERDGIELATALIAEGSLRAGGWLALVELRDVDAQRRAVAVGCATLVLKPFKPTQVAAQVAAVAGPLFTEATP
jgi:DNA-binding response OmpR family regulator